jgi:DNA replication protein DnaC
MSDTQNLEILLKSLNLPSFTNHYKDFAVRAQKEGLSFIDYLASLVTIEKEDRYSRRTDRLLKLSRLPLGKNIEDFNTKRLKNFPQNLLDTLLNGSCIDKAENIIIVGKTGTGKTHLAAGLGKYWCLANKTVFFSTLANLVQKLLEGKRNLNLNNLIIELNKFDVIIIDDISYVPLEPEETTVFFNFLSHRYEYKSILITSAHPFSELDKIFKDTFSSQALIDRLIYNSHIIELVGESYRSPAKMAQKK